MKSSATAIVLLLGGCMAAEPPRHPLAGTWQGGKDLVLMTTEYEYGGERGFWSADSRTFRHKVNPDGIAKAEERCSFSLSGRTLTLTGCRLAGRYVRTS